MYPYRIKGENKNSLGAYPWRKFRKRAEALENVFLLKQKGIQAEMQEYDQEKSAWVLINPSAYCRRCGRKLSDPSSVKNGLGKECQKKAAQK